MYSSYYPSIVWVKTREEAEKYMVAPNNSVLFLEEGLTHLYMKAADQFGRPSFVVKILSDEKTEEQPEYLTRAEFNSWLEEFKRGGMLSDQSTV